MRETRARQAGEYALLLVPWIWAVYRVHEISIAEASALLVFVGGSAGWCWPLEEAGTTLPSPTSPLLPGRSSKQNGQAIGCLLIPFVLCALRVVNADSAWEDPLEKLLWTSISCSVAVVAGHYTGHGLWCGFLGSAAVTVVVVVVAVLRVGSMGVLAVFCGGLLAVWSVESLQACFPDTFSCGERTLVGSMVSLVGVGAVEHAICGITCFDSMVPSSMFPTCEPHASAVSSFVAGLLALVLMVLVLLYQFPRWGVPISQISGAGGAYAVIGLSYVMVGEVALFWDLPSWSVHWVVDTLWSRSIRLVLCFFWVVLLSAALWGVRYCRPRRVPLILVRKIFHVLSVFMFLPGILLDEDFMRLAFGVAFGGMLLLEALRYLDVPPLAAPVHRFMIEFTDSRDAGPLILTHLYLLFGCAVSTWAATVSPSTSFVAYAGTIILGVGDSMASLVGHRYGRIPWPCTRKTIEGTGGALGSLLLLGAIHSTLHARDLIWFAGFSLASALVCILEALTLQIDNIVLPLYFTGVLTLFSDVPL